MDIEKRNLNEHEIQDIFDRYVVPRVFGIADSPSYDAAPVTVLIGAQPAAGKTRGQRRAIALYDMPLIPIVGDDFRQFHPQYDEIMRTDPISMPDVTKQLSGKLVEKCIDYANKHGYSTIVEGTWRSCDVVMKTAKTAKECGRDVHLVALATKPAISRIGIFSRYYDDVSHGIPARWTPIEAHETVLKNLESNVLSFSLSELFDNYKVIDRSGDVLYDGPDGSEWHDVWHESFTAPLTAGEQEFVDEKSERYRILAAKYTPEHVCEVESVLSAARSGSTDPLVYVEPYVRKGHSVSGYYRRAPSRS